MPSSSSMLTRTSACRPPKRLEISHSSSNAILVLRLLLRRQNSLRTKDHHENQNQAKYHALVLRRLELHRQLRQRPIAKQRQRKHGARLAQIVEPERQAFEQLQIENRHAGGAEDRAGDRAHAAEDDHGEHADGFHESEALGVDENLLGRE